MQALEISLVIFMLTFGVVVICNAKLVLVLVSFSVSSSSSSSISSIWLCAVVEIKIYWKEMSLAGTGVRLYSVRSSSVSSSSSSSVSSSSSTVVVL
jgi:hypothetical protein